MLSPTRSPGFLGATSALSILLASAVLLDQSLAAPQAVYGNDISRRTDNAPGLGVEIEFGKVVIKGKRDLTPDEEESIKGATMTPIGFAGEKKTNWKLTAEVGDKSLLPEVIVDGLKNKVGDEKTGAIGEEIYEYAKGWAPCRKNECKVNIENFDHLGPWTVRWPENLEDDLSDFRFTAQVTTAMPFAAVYEILDDSMKKREAPLTADGLINRNIIKMLTNKDFAQFKKIKQKAVTQEFLGAFTLLTNYCKIAKGSNPIHGPKRELPIMPRTNFVTQYKDYIEPVIKRQLSKKVSLYDIVQAVSGSRESLAKDEFKWKPRQPTAVPETWPNKNRDLETGRLEVEKFLNHLQGYDKAAKKKVVQLDLIQLMEKSLRHGQIGGLGTKKEAVLNSKKKLAPIFEFRELKPQMGQAIVPAMRNIEGQIEEFHKQFAKRSLEGQEETDTAEESDNSEEPETSEGEQW